MRRIPAVLAIALAAALSLQAVRVTMAGASVGVTMYDASVTAYTEIPTSTQMVAGGNSWTSGDFANFPNSQTVRIDCSGSDYSYQVVDYESGCVDIKKTLQTWVTDHNALGEGYAVVYVWEGKLTTVEKDLSGYNYYLWVADQTGTEHMYEVNGSIPAGEIATQWCGYSSGSDNCQGLASTDKVDESEVTNPQEMTGQAVPIMEGTAETNSGTGTSGSTITANLPSGISSGDKLLCYLAWNGTSTTPSISGWASYTKETGTIGVALFSKTATGGEGSTVSISFASGYVYAVTCADYTDTASISFDPTPANSGQVNAASTTISVPGVTTTDAGDELVWFGATTGASGTAPGVITVPGNFTAEGSQNNSDTSSYHNSGIRMADEYESASGATGAQNGTSSTSVINAGVLVSLHG